MTNKKTNPEFKETVKQRASHDPEFRTELLKEALEAINCGDIEVAKALLEARLNKEEANDE